MMDTESGSSAVIDRARQAHIVSHADEAAEQIGRWQARGLKVGFTNGCFDILHPGHVRYLNGARDKCDRLVVGVNTDDSVRRLKGPSRPVNDEHARAAVIAALGSVDLVVFFGGEKEDEDKAVRLVSRLKPDIYFKGGDYKEENVPETKIVRGYGGDVRILPLYEGHSTTATIGRAKGKA
jgi:D-beta-D-heptose 7-phosphate kinase/D-beta-D-heptose 1-phosphate adenosyltransferase